MSVPGGEFFSFANSVSGDGTIVVGYSMSQNDTGESVEKAFIWDEVRGMQDLQTALSEDVALEATLLN